MADSHRHGSPGPEENGDPARVSSAETRYRTPVEQAMDGIFLTDATSAFIEVNDAGCAMLGYSRDELLGMSIRDFVPPQRREISSAGIATLSPGGVLAEHQLVTRKDGSRFVAEIAAQVLPDGSLMAIVRDISERAAAETGLFETAARAERRANEATALMYATRAVVEESDFPAAARIVFDACKAIVGARAGYVALLSEDGSENEVLFLDSGNERCAVDPSLPMPVRGLREQAYLSGTPGVHNGFETSEWTALLPAGHAPLHSVLFAPLVIDGKTHGLIGLANKPGGFDEDDRALTTSFAEIVALALRNAGFVQLLAENEKQFRAQFEGASDAILWVDAETGIVTRCNRAAETLMACDRAGILGRHLTALYPPGQAERCTAHFEAVVAGGEEPLLLTQILRPDGSTVAVEMTASGAITSGRPQIQEIFRDVSRRDTAEANYRMLFAEMLDGFALHEIICDSGDTPVDYRFLAVNPSFERLTGLKAQDIVGRTVLDVMPDTEVTWIETYGRVALTGEPILFEDYSAGLDKYFEVKAFRPAPGRFACVFEDVTDRRRAAELLERHSDLLARTERTAHVGSWRRDPKAGAADWSEEMYRICGLDPATRGPVSYDEFARMVHPDDRARFLEARAALERDGGPQPVEYRVVRPDGEVRWVYSKGSVELNETGSCVAMTGYVQDITETKEALDALRWTQDKLAQAHQVARIGVWDWVVATDTVTWSDELYSMIGLDDVMPAPSFAELPAFYTPESWESLVAAVERALDTGEPYDLELDMVGADGTLCHTRTVGSSLRGSDGADIGLHGTVHDITERKKAGIRIERYRDRLRALTADLVHAGERERRRLAAELHDEVGQLLVAAKMRAQGLVLDEDDLNAPENLRLMLELLDDAVEGTRRLTSEISPPLLYELGLGPALEWLVERLGERSGLEIDLRVETEPRASGSDADVVLFRAARELLNNVDRHSGVKLARMTVTAEERCISMRIEDGGRGFDSSVLGIRSGPDDHLGLFSLMEEVEGAGGTVEVSSEPGGGTRVVVRVPVKTSAPVGDDEVDDAQT